MMDYVNENKIFLKDEPQDKSVSQKIRFYNNQNILFRKKSNSSIGSRERCNSDTYIIEQKLQENKSKDSASSNRCNTLCSMQTNETVRNNTQPSVIIQMGNGVSSSALHRHKSNPYLSPNHSHPYNRNSLSSPLAQSLEMQTQRQMPTPSAPVALNNNKMDIMQETDTNSIPPAYHS